ncbi:short chain dehydrogenase/reductase [Polychaeton citri CBS 116435]|uniref:Short chain dehydrogenase/reductase n=1 Tax=Polychaeton citri CBS 116435 TaxID=1314669 RepID=A0A9P4PZT2_9PEZI|nr:short chain dehydrogenase/reductase [Polychaeton citri CBS 116435]
MATPLIASNIHNIDGLVAVVTGGGTGLGHIITKTLIQNGASKVYITGRRLEKLEEAAKEAPGKIIPIQADVTDHDDTQAAVDKITEETGYIDLLVNNAGMTTFDASGQRAKPTAESSISEIRDYYFNYRPADLWKETLNTNIGAVFTLTIAFLELLDAGNKRRDSDKPKSQVIAVGSVGGLTRFTDSFIYNASKAAVHHLMKNLGAFLVPHDIRTNIIAPGWFPSDMTTAVSKAWESTGGVMPRTLVPQQRMGYPEELAGTIMYLVSKAGGYCNGQICVIDGGFLHNHAGTY